MNIRRAIAVMSFGILAVGMLGQTKPATKPAATKPATSGPASAPAAVAVSGKMVHNGKTFVLVDGVASLSSDNKTVVAYLFDKKLTDEELAGAKGSRDAMWHLLWNRPYLEAQFEMKDGAKVIGDVVRFDVVLADGGDRGKDGTYVTEWADKDKGAVKVTVTAMLKEGSPLTVTTTRVKAANGDEWDVKLKLPLILH